MAIQNNNSAILLISCKDSNGIIASVTKLLSSLGANILGIDQHVDRENGIFFMRVEWDLVKFSISTEKFKSIFSKTTAKEFSMRWSFYLKERKLRMALWVSKQGHAMFDILSSWSNGDLSIDIPVIISNHEKFRSDAERFNIPFIYLPVTSDNREELAIEQLKTMQGNSIDFIVLARYMQIIPSSIINHYENKIINIHHSFLPSFSGAKPYHKAFDRGVKIIGATAHFVTEELDEGPIIEQEVERVNHQYSVDNLISIGRDLEKRTLSKAIRYYTERRVLVRNNRTIVFSN